MTALADFRRQGGAITVLLGNHDAWLSSFYEKHLGACVVSEPVLDLTVAGLRIHLAHGHLLGSRRLWKKAMEGRLFLEGFRRLPLPAAVGLEGLLDYTNEAQRKRSNVRHLQTFRRYADMFSPRTDLVVLGHVHRTLDDSSTPPRLIVLGDWLHQSSYLRVDSAGAQLIIQPDGQE